MAEENDEPNVTRIVWSTHEPNILRCKYVVDFTTPEGAEMLRKLNSPEGVRRWLDAAIGNCWIALPIRNRDLAMLDREMRGLFELTIENLYAHPQAFRIEEDVVDPRAQEFRNDRFLGPSASVMLLMAAETCVNMLPPEKRKAAPVECELRTLFERALTDWLSNPPQMDE